MDFKDEALTIYNQLNRYYPVEIDEAVEWLSQQLENIARAYADQRN